MKLATEVLKQEKKKVIFWKTLTILSLVIIAIETSIILFQKGKRTMKRTDLQIKTGTIAELCGLIRDAKTDYNKSIDALNRDTTYKDEYKKELANRYKTSLDAKILEYEAGIKQGIYEKQSHQSISRGGFYSVINTVILVLFLLL